MLSKSSLFFFWVYVCVFKACSLSYTPLCSFSRFSCFQIFILCSLNCFVHWFWHSFEVCCTVWSLWPYFGHKNKHSRALCCLCLCERRKGNHYLSASKASNWPLVTDLRVMIAITLPYRTKMIDPSSQITWYLWLNVAIGTLGF